MNKIFKVIWSKSRNCYVVASELAKGTSKSTSTGRMAKRAVLAAVAALLISPLGAGYVSAADGYVTVKDTNGTEQTVYTKDGVDNQLKDLAKQTDVNTNQNNIATLQTQVSTNTTDIATNKANIETLQTNTQKISYATEYAKGITTIDSSLNVTDHLVVGSSIVAGTNVRASGFVTTPVQVTNGTGVVQSVNQLTISGSTIQGGTATKNVEVNSKNNVSLTAGTRQTNSATVSGGNVINQASYAILNNAGTGIQNNVSGDNGYISNSAAQIKSVASKTITEQITGTDSEGNQAVVNEVQSDANGTTFTNSGSSTTIKGNAISTGSIDATGNISAASVDVSDKLTAGSASVTNSISVGHNANVGGAVNAGSLNSRGNLNVDGNALVKGTLTSQSTINGNEIVSQTNITAKNKVVGMQGVVDNTLISGNYVTAGNTVGENIVALDTQAKANADAIEEEARKRKYSVTNLENADKQLQTNINNEAAAREAKDNELNERITNEANAIHETTNKLQDDLNTETTAREAADNELNERITNEANAIHETTNQLQSDLNTETAAREAGDTALNERITNVKEYLEKQTSDNYVSKTDATVQDGAVVKAANTIGENVTNLDAALAKETAARIGADAAQDKVIEQVNQNMVDGFNTINKNMADGFTALNQADANEAAAREAADTTLQTNIDNEAAERKAADTVLDDKITAETSARVAADTKLVEAVNSGLSLSNDNVLQKNTTTIDAQGNVTTSKTDANEMILNKGKDNQITLNEKGVKVGTNSSVMDKDGVYTGGDTYSEAKAAMSADGKIKGANGAFTVDENGNVTSKATITGETVTDGKGASMSNGTVTGKTLTDGIATITNGNVNTSGSITGGTVTSTGNISALGDIHAGGAITGASASIQGALTAGSATITGDLTAGGAIQGKSISDGTATMQNGNLTGVKNLSAETITTSGDATIGGDLTVNGKLNVDEIDLTKNGIVGDNNVTASTKVAAGEITGYKKATSTKDGSEKESAIDYDENGTSTWAKATDADGNWKKSTLTVEGSDVTSKVVDSDKNSNLSAQTSTQSQSTLTDKDSNTNTATQSATESSSTLKDKDGKTSTFKQRVGEILNQINSSDTVFSKVDQKVDNITSEVTDGTNTTSSAQTTTDITNTANNGTISNTAKNIENTASENITNTAKNGSITNDAKNIANIASETLSNSAKNITNTTTDNMTNTIGKNLTTTVGGDMSTEVTGNQSNTVKGTLTETVTGKVTEDYKSDLSTKVGGNETHYVAGSQTNTVSGDRTVNVKGTETENFNAQVTNVKTDQRTSVGGNQTNIVGGDQQNTVSGSKTETVKGSVTEKYGSQATTVDGDQSTHVGGNQENVVTGNQTNTISGSKTETVKGAVSETYGSQTTKVNGDQSTTVTGKQTNSITGDQVNTIGGSQTTTVTGDVTEDYKANLSTTVGGNQTTTVTGDSSLTAENINNTAKNKITNKAIDVETAASSSIVNKVSNDAGSNTSTQLSYETKEEMSQADGKTASYLRGAAEEKSQLIDGANKTTIDTIAGQTNTNITDGTNTSNSLQKTDQVASSVTDGTNTTVVNQDAKSLASSITDGTKSNNTNNTVDKSEQLIKASDTQYSATSKTATKMEDALVSGSSIIDVIKNLDDAANPFISSAVTDGTNSTGVTQTAKDITNTAKNGTIANDAKDIINNATENMTNTVGKDLTTTVGGEMKTTVTGKVTEDYKSDLDTKVGGTLTETVTGKATENYNGGLETTITGEEKHTVNGNQINNITGDQTNTIGGSQTTTVTGDSSLSAQNITNTASETLSNSAKNITNTATEKLSNSAAEIENTASKSITDKVGDNVSRTMTTSQIKESVVDGANSNTSTKTASKDMNIVTDGTSTSTLSQLAGSVNTSLKEVDSSGNSVKSLNNVQTVSEDTTKITDTATGDFSSRSQKANGFTSQVKNNSGGSNTVTDTATTSEQKLVSGNIIDILKNAETGYVNTTVSSGTGDDATSTSVSQGSADITNTAKQGTITNDAKNLVNKAEEKLSNSAAEIENTATTSIKDTVGKSTVTTTTDGTTFENTDHNTAIGDGSITKTTISGNTLETGKATMDYAEVMKDLTVGGTTTTKDLHVTNNATIDGTLDVAGAANFQDTVNVAKDLSVGGNASVSGSMTASSYKVGDKTYIDDNGINANNQKITNVAAGELSANSLDAVNGSQLYETNRRVSKMDSRINEVGANAAAMANLHPLEFDADSKFNVAAAVGNYKNETATALGLFYRPNEDVMVNLSGTVGSDDNMIGGGVAVRIGRGGNKARNKQMAESAKYVKNLESQVNTLQHQMDALLSVLNPNLSKEFPDVPENHWAYEAVSRLAGNGIIQGYEDGKYHGERTMTRYEMAEIIYKALQKGAKAEAKLVEEFKPELKAMAAQNKA